MSKNNLGLKTSLFGFKRSQVVEYIVNKTAEFQQSENQLKSEYTAKMDKLQADLDAQLDSLKAELNGVKEQRNELSAEKRSTEQKLDVLSKAFEEKNAIIAEIGSRLQQAEADRKTTALANAELIEHNQQLENELRELNATVAELDDEIAGLTEKCRLLEENGANAVEEITASEQQNDSIFDIDFSDNTDDSDEEPDEDLPDEINDVELSDETDDEEQDEEAYAPDEETVEPPLNLEKPEIFVHDDVKSASDERLDALDSRVTGIEKTLTGVVDTNTALADMMQGLNDSFSALTDEVRQIGTRPVDAAYGESKKNQDLPEPEESAAKQAEASQKKEKDRDSVIFESVKNEIAGAMSAIAGKFGKPKDSENAG